MKKITALFAAALLLCGCSAAPSSASETPSETPVPVAEDEYAAGDVILKIKETDMSGYRWLEDTDPAFVQVTMEESFRLFEEKGTALILYSYDTCPWCNRAVPVLNAALKAAGMKGVYVDIYEQEIKDMDKDVRMAVIDKLYKNLDAVLDHETNPETGKVESAMYVPLVVAIKDGEILDHHTSLVESFEMKDEDTQMTDEQNAELKSYYDRLIKEVQ